jgi:hypothetical protein
MSAMPAAQTMMMEIIVRRDCNMVMSDFQLDCSYLPVADCRHRFPRVVEGLTSAALTSVVLFLG